MTNDDCRSELLVAARRGRLSDAGRLALDAHLGACASCRLSYDVSADFDAADAVDLHDGARIRALADRARRRAGRGGRAPVSLRAVGAAAALVIFCGSASAAVWWWRRPGSAPTAPATPASAPPRESAARRLHGPAMAVVTPAAPQIAAPRPPEAAARPRAARPLLRAAVETGPADPIAPIAPIAAASILRQATEARQRGERARAGELYHRLQREFPASAEAVLSAIPLGGLLLDDGLPRAALAEFDGYLTRARGGALIPEALYGRARALARLGDRVEERRTWTRLCADFPDSAYAPLGRHRLAEIE